MSRRTSRGSRLYSHTRSRVVFRLLGKREIQCEVGRVPRHGILTLYVEFKTRHREILHRRALHGVRIDRVTLRRSLAVVERVFEEHVLVERIVFGRRFSLLIE